MTYEVLEQKIKTIPQNSIQEVYDYIEYVCYKNEKKVSSVQNKDFSAVKAMFGTVSADVAQDIRKSRINFQERI